MFIFNYTWMTTLEAPLSNIKILILEDSILFIISFIEFEEHLHKISSNQTQRKLSTNTRLIAICFCLHFDNNTQGCKHASCIIDVNVQIRQPL